MKVQTGLTGFLLLFCFLRANLDRNCCVWNGEEQRRGKGRAGTAIHTPSDTHRMQYAGVRHRENTGGAWLSHGLVPLLSPPDFGKPHRFSFISTARSTWAKCLSFYSCTVGIHSSFPQLGLWNFKMFSPRSTSG